MAIQLDPIKYEVFRHRLFNVLEEGRIAIRFVSGSPVVVEGGECMCAFFSSDGTPILIAAGVTLHSIGARDFIKKCIEWYEQDPGIYDGDQFFFAVDARLACAEKVQVRSVKDEDPPPFGGFCDFRHFSPQNAAF